VSAPPLVSVIMPCYNAAPFVAEAIESVRAQTWDRWELIVIDDASTDTSRETIASICAIDPRVSLIDMPQRSGPGPARNAGVASAKGRYIAFLDADDLWHREKLLRQIPWMQECGHVLSFTAYMRRNERTGVETFIGAPAEVQRESLVKSNVIACSTAVYDRSYFGLRQQANLPMRQDYAFWLNLLEDGRRAVGLREPLMTYRLRPDSLSGSKIRAAIATWHLYRRHLGLGLLPALWFFSHYAFFGLMRHRFPMIGQRIGILAGPVAHHERAWHAG